LRIVFQQSGSLSNPCTKITVVGSITIPCPEQIAGQPLQ
jgi:hypothetical protein